MQQFAAVLVLFLFRGGESCETHILAIHVHCQNIAGAIFDICWLPVACHIQNGTLCYKSESTKFCTVCKSLGKKEPKWRFPLVKYLYDVFENFRTFYVYKTTNMCIIIFYYC